MESTCEWNKVASLAITIMLIAGFALASIPVRAQTTVVKMIPASEDATYVGQLITFAAVVEDVTNLAGVGFQITWNTTYLDYHSHTMTMPVDTYNIPQPPSPYAGLMNAPILTVADVVDSVAGTYDAAVSTLGGTPFTGNGTAFVITFQVKSIPFEGDIGFVPYIDLPVTFTLHDLADPVPTAIPHTVEDGNVRLYPIPRCYPELPLLKVMPEIIECTGVNESVFADVYLMGADHGALDPFWDPAGFDVYMNFDTTMIEAMSVTVDPDLWLDSFFDVVLVVAQDIDNVAGTVHVAFLGYGNHTAVFGIGRLFTVEFNSLTEADTYPPATSEICLKNPIVYTGEYVFDSFGGVIDIADPVGTTYNQITPRFLEGFWEMLSWEDNGDGILSPSDQFILEDTLTGYYYTYLLTHITATLNLSLARYTDPMVWATNSITPDGLANFGLPGRVIVPTTSAAYNGYGLPNWTGNFSLPYLVDSVNSITVHALPFTGDEYTYTLTEGVDFIVHADDDLIELLTPLDVQIINECWTDGVNNTLNGWPWINYMASSIQSVYVDMHNGTARFGINCGFEQPPPCEWWFEPDWPWELEGWWALGYFPGSWNWPAGSTWWINYTAASYMEIDFNTDPTSAYVEFTGSYNGSLGFCDPTGTTWKERYPISTNSYTWESWIDDGSGCLSEGDLLGAPGGILYRVDGLAIDLITLIKPCICNEDPVHPFYCMPPIVEVAGFPHPERDYCPWHGVEWSVKLPHVVECATYQECFKPSGGFIDIYTPFHPPGYNGEGLNNPGDLIWPQKGFWICANVTYAQWPEQNKDVAFEVLDPQGVTWGIFVNRTNDAGVACIFVRMPWPCDDPDYYLGEWCIIATVDVACTIVNDTMCFKYDYKVNIWNATIDKESYRHCESITVTIEYGSYAMNPNFDNITFAITAVDASGVPFGFAYVTVTIGEAEYCSYKNDVIELSVHVAKFARPPISTLYVVALNGLPSEGGSAESPVFTVIFSIEAAWV